MKEEILKELQSILAESVRLYNANGKAAYEAGRIDGVKWCIEAVNKI